MRGDTHVRDLWAACASLLLDHQDSVVGALVTVVLAALVLLVALPAGVHALGDFRPDCTVRATGGDFNVELSGWRAGAACRRLVAGTRRLSEGPASGAVVCTAHVQGLTESVRDNSFVPLLGALICSGIHGTLPSSPPSQPGSGGFSL